MNEIDILRSISSLYEVPDTPEGAERIAKLIEQVWPVLQQYDRSRITDAIGRGIRKLSRRAEGK